MLGHTLTGFVQRYRARPAAGTFRLITSPLIQWMWIGALIAIGGGLIGCGPRRTPRGARRPPRPPPGSRRTSAGPVILALDVLVFLLILVALALVVWLVGTPLRAGPQAAEDRVTADRQRLEAARDAKSREIRELELDLRTGSCRTRTSARSTVSSAPRRS